MNAHSGHRHNYKSEELDVLLAAFRKTGSCVETAGFFGMSLRTGRKYNKIFHDNGGVLPPIKKKGGSKKMLDDAQIDQMIQWVEENEDITLIEIGAKVHLAYPRLNVDKLCTTTIWNYLEGRLISTKLIRYIHQDANSDANKQARVDYITLLTALPAATEKVYIDETNFTIMTRRKCGHAPIGQRAHVTTALNGCKKINLIHAISSQVGNLFTEKTDGNVDGNRFDEYITHLVDNIHTNHPLTNYCLIMDNAPVHRKATIQAILDAPQYGNMITLLMLPPYSPFLNPIESVFSSIKAHVKEYLRFHNDEMIGTANLPWGQKAAGRYAILEKAIAYAMPFITIPMVLNFFLFTTTFHVAVINKDRIEI